MNELFTQILFLVSNFKKMVKNFKSLINKQTIYR